MQFETIVAKYLSSMQVFFYLHSHICFQETHKIVFNINQQEEKRTLERELARVKVSASRVALAFANEWKDENDRVMPVKQWLEERRLLHVIYCFLICTNNYKLMKN